MSRPWMPLYIGDYLRDTHHLTTVQHGAYLLLIMHYWTHGSLPTDHAELKRIVGLHSVHGENQWRSICLAIAPFFDENWKHKRIEKELEKYRIISEKRAFAGRNGGLKSRGHTNLARHLDQAIAKQAGHQPHKYKSLNSESEIRAREESGGREEQAGNGVTEALEENLKRKGPPEAEKDLPGKRASDYGRAELEQIYAAKHSKPK